MADSKTIVVSYSGGLDSTVLLYNYLHLGWDVRALSIDYGQRHRRELQTAADIIYSLNHDYGRLRHRTIDMQAILPLLEGSSQTSNNVAVPEGHYEQESMKQTVVPNRNMILLALAGAWAVSLKARGVAIAAHGGDHAIYPDCRPEFMMTMGAALGMADWHTIELQRPFLTPNVMSKADIVKLGAELNVPMHATWSCYKGGNLHCGRCGTCVERREAFIDAGVPDLTEYMDNGPLPKKG